MKASKSNSRVAFVYQITQAQAGVLNSAYRGETSTSPIIRVVQPGSDVTGVGRNPNYDSESSHPVEHVANDRLISAYIKTITSKSINSGSELTTTIRSTVLSDRTTKNVTTIQADFKTDTVIIDIEPTSATGVLPDFFADGKSVVAIIALFFESGAEESASIILKDANHCFINPDPFELSLGKPFSPNVSIPPSLNGVSGGNASFVGYNINKIYRQKSSSGLLNPIYYSFKGFGANDSGSAEGYTASFGIPFGVIRKMTGSVTEIGTFQSSADLEAYSDVSYSWADNAFASRGQNALYWFSGNSDMSTVYIDSPDYSGVPAAEEAADQDIDFGKFFEFKPVLAHITDTSDTVYDKYWPAGPPRWGQNFGWCSAFENTRLYKLSGAGATSNNDSDNIAPGSAGSVGVPFHFHSSRRDFHDNLYGDSHSTNIAGANYPSLIGGDFQVVGPLYNDGYYNPNLTLSFGSDFFESNIGEKNGPQSAKIQKLLFGGSMSDNNSPEPSNQGLYDGSEGFGTTSGQIAVTSVAPNASDATVMNSTVDSPVTFGAFPYISHIDLEAAKTYRFAWAPVYPGVVGTQKMQSTGSIGGLCTTNNVNFFYAGCSQTTSGDVVEPVFHGTARVIYIERFGVSIDTLNGLVQAITLYPDTDSAPDYTYPNTLGRLNTKTVYMAASGTNLKANQRLNAIDLLMSTLYNNYKYGGPGGLLAGNVLNESSNSVVTYMMPNTAASNGSNYGKVVRRWAEQSLISYTEFKDPNAAGSSAITGIGSGLRLYAQDIVVVNSAVNTISDDTTSVPYGAALASHPVGMTLNQTASKTTTPPNITAAVNTMTVDADTEQVSPVPTPNLDTYNEGINGGVTLPPYPIPYYNYSKKFTGTYKSNKFTTGSEAYSDSEVANGGNTFVDHGAEKGGVPVLPDLSNPDGSDFIMCSGNTTEPKCFKVLSTAVFFGASVVGDWMNMNLSPGSAGKRLRFYMKFKNTCNNLFKTLAGQKEVTGGSVSDRVTKILEIFPRIELYTMSSNPAYSSGANNANLAYKIILTDENDIDNLYITAVAGETDVYELYLEFNQQVTDIYNNPNDEFDDDVNIGLTQFFEDFQPNKNSPRQNVTTNYNGSQFGEFEGDPLYGKVKASFITVSTQTDWADKDPLNSSEREDEELVIQVPFYALGRKTYSDAQDILDESVAVYGCTDSTAINYNADATTDDGTCIDCEDEANAGAWNLGADGLVNTSLDGIRVGLSKNQAEVDYYYTAGYIAGEGSFASGPLDLTGQPDAAVYNSSGANYGGAVLCNNDFLGETAVGQMDFKATISGGGAGLNSMLQSATLTAANATYDSWQLRIIPASDALLDEVDLEFSYSNDNPPPSSLTSASAVYTSDATSGTLFAPEWNNVVTPDNTIAGIKAGQPYLLELKFAPKGLPAGCDTFNSGNAVIYGLMWTQFCSCATISNPYFSEAMLGQGYPWNNSISFPIQSYEGLGCPDTPEGWPGSALGDTDYPDSICYRSEGPDGEELKCENMFLFCIAQEIPDCFDTISDISEAYDAGSNQYYYNLEDYTLILLVEGAYNYFNDQYQFMADLAYTVTIQGPDGLTVATQTQADAATVTGQGGSNGLQNTFTGLTEPGVYTISWIFTGPEDLYPPYFNDTMPCILTEQFTVGTPDNYCPEVVQGCTDSNAPNFDPAAILDDGSCEEPVDECVPVLANTNLIAAATSTPCTLECSTVTIVVGGVETTTQVPTPVSPPDGTITVTVDYTAETGIADGEADGAITQFAILIWPANVANPYINGIIDSTSYLFSADIYPTSTEVGTSLTMDAGGGVTETIGVFSPLFLIDGGTDSTHSFTFEALPPNTYYFAAIPDLGSVTLNECSEQPVIRLEDSIKDVRLLTGDVPADCEEDCIGADCEEWIKGCTNPDAENYNPLATVDDGSCEFEGSFCDLNPTDESCIDCETEQAAAARFSSGRLDETICDPVNGNDGECTDPNACNYNPDAPLEASNNQICDYCSCLPIDDPDCTETQECDPDEDPDCAPPEPECPDPGNPNCDPTIFDPCPSGDCPPPPDPCIALGNCPDGPSGDGEDPIDPFTWNEPTVELTCVPLVAGVGTEEEFFDSVIKTAFKCMTDEGKKMLFRMKAGAYYEEEDLIKLSLIAYLLNGGTNFSELPCIFNCNYESAEKKLEFDCQQEWYNKGARFWNSTDTFTRGEMVVHFYPINGVVQQSIYIADRTIDPGGIAPRYPQSGWHRCKTVRTRTKDVNGIADGTETYLQTFWEYLTRFCTSCEIAPNAYDPATTRDINEVDPTILPNYLDAPVEKTNSTTGSGILGEDGDEIRF